MLVPSVADAYRFFHEGTKALAAVENRGIRIDTEYLQKTMEEMKRDIIKNEEKFKKSDIYVAWRKRYKDPNIESSEQLAEVLFNVMGYKCDERTATGKFKADESVLEKVPNSNVTLFLLIKKQRKILNTYLRGIEREVCNGVLRPSYNLIGGYDDDKEGGAMSWRGSCSDPNFQNMPIRNKMMGKIIRDAIIPREDGYVLGEIDYSTIEVRIAGATTKDTRLLDYIKNSPPKDMHRDAASELFLLPPEKIGRKSTRDAAKNKFVFPQFYGSFYADCAKAIWEMMIRNEYKVEGSDELVIDHLRKKGITKLGKCDPESPPKKGTFEHRVKEVEDKFWNKWFTGYTAWKKKVYNQYLETGEVHLATGFIARGIYRKNQVLNLPIQGPAFHCLLWSIIELEKEFKKRKLKSMIVGQIHDCVLVDIHKSEIQEVLSLMKEVMTKRIRKHWPWLIVPLEIEADIVDEGKTWNDKYPWILEKGIWKPKPKEG